MVLRSRIKAAAPAIKPAPNAGLMLFVAGDLVDCDWVRLVLAEKDVDGAQVQLLRPGAANEDFLVLNPAQTVPTLADREGVLTGARVIAEYLDERYPHPPLMPQEPAARARARMALEQLERDLFPLAAALGGAARAAAAARSELLGRLRRGPRHMAAQGWFLGREFSLVDCAWAALLRRLGAHGVEPHGAESESLRRYAARLGARAAYKRCFEAKPAGSRR
jgi:RNA polymerase-associated protein